MKAKRGPRPDVVEAEEFARNFEPIEGKDYRWVTLYAKDHFERLHGAWEAIDDKADKLIGYLGGGTGLFAIGTVSSIDSGNWRVFALAGPAIICATLSIAFAVAARSPRTSAIPPSIEDTIKYVDGIESRQEEFFLGQWHLTCETVRIALASKARLVQRAMVLFGVAVAGLLPSFVAAVYQAAR